jgi:gliding motility-associated-like protein
MMKSFLLIGAAMMAALSFVVAQNCNDFTLSISPDTTLCSPAAELSLSGSASSPPFDWAWSPAAGLNTTEQGSVLAQPTVTTTYTLTARAIRENLIFNGNFALGAVGFTTDYNPASGGPNGPLDNEGEFMVDDDPSDTHQNFAACDDHTTGDGNMMVVNSADSQDQVWCQVVSVTPNTDYAFSAWATSVFFENPASLQFSFDGVLLGSVFDASSAVCEWQQFFATWSSGANTDVEICITNVNSAASGNDFAIDDIAFGEICEASAEVTVTVGEELPSPQPACEASSSSITLSWPAIATATGYQVEVLNAPAGSFTADTVYTVDGLSPGQEVNFELQSLQGACAGPIGTFSCTTLECPDYDLEVTAYDSIICEGSPASLEIAINTSSGGPFSLALDIDGLPATFDNLSPGTNTIELQVNGSSTIAFTGLSDGAYPSCTINALPEELAITLERMPSAGQPLPYEACVGEETVLQLEETLQNADEGGLWQTVAEAPDWGGAFDPGLATVDIAALPPADYQLQYIVEAAVCANDTAIVPVTINASPQAAAGGLFRLDCVDTEARLGQPDNGQGWRYAWVNLSGPAVEPGDTPQITVGTAGQYVLQVLDPVTGCSALDTAVVEDWSSVPEPVLTVVQSNCPGETGTIVVDTVRNGNGPFVYSIDGDNFGAKAEFTQLPAGQYEITVQDIGGCEGSATALLRDDNSFTAVVTASPGNRIAQGESVELQVDYVLSVGQLSSINWWPAPDSCQSCPQISVQPSRSQLYIVSLTDEQGCTVSDSIRIVVEQKRRVYAPTAFSPNDDGVNDRYYFQTGSEFVRGTSWYIVNRWGSVVFKAEDFALNDPAAGWDGTFEGEQLQAGVYTFVATLELSDGRNYQFGGALHLMR